MEQEQTRRPAWQLGSVIPCLLVAALLVDIVARFMSVDPLTFRGWEAMSRFRPPGAAFEPNRRYSSARTYGDTAAMGNMPELRQYRLETFTTDAFGFRNVGDMWASGVTAVMIGDSQVVGSGVSDSQTLPSRLSALTRCGVYNAGSEDAKPPPDRVITLSHNLHVHEGLVIHLYTETRDLPTVPSMRKRRTDEILSRVPNWVGTGVGRLRGFIDVSPLQILSTRAMKGLENGWILPNPYAANVVKATLYNGDTMLFPAAHVEHFYRMRPVAVDYWAWLREELQKERLDLLVVLVPGKYRVYRPFLLDQKPGDGENYLGRLERKLRAAGIPVVNLAPVFAARVAESLGRHEYLYWLDDIHWNTRGTDVAAQAIREVWPGAKTSCTLDRALTRAPFPPAGNN